MPPASWRDVRPPYNAVMALSPDICIRGAGIVGRALALLLARERLNVALVESAPPAGVSDVRAYAMNGASKALLQELRCWPDSPAVTPVHRMQVWGDQGGQLNFGAQDHGVGELNWMVDVPVLQHRLNQAVQFQPQIQVVQAPMAAPLTVVCEAAPARPAPSWVWVLRSRLTNNRLWPPVCSAITRTQGSHGNGLAGALRPACLSRKPKCWRCCPWAAKAVAKSPWSGRCTDCAPMN